MPSASPASTSSGPPAPTSGPNSSPPKPSSSSSSSTSHSSWPSCTFSTTPASPSPLTSPPSSTICCSSPASLSCRWSASPSSLPRLARQCSPYWESWLRSLACNLPLCISVPPALPSDCRATLPCSSFLWSSPSPCCFSPLPSFCSTAAESHSNPSPSSPPQQCC